MAFQVFGEQKYTIEVITADIVGEKLREFIPVVEYWYSKMAHLKVLLCIVYYSCIIVLLCQTWS